MAARSDRSAALGVGALALALLVFSSPTPTRAEERVSDSPAAAASHDPAAQTPSSDEASTCRVDGPPRRSAAAALAEIRARIAASAAGEGAPHVVELGNRGYRYGEPAAIDPSLLEFEAREQAP